VPTVQGDMQRSDDDFRLDKRGGYPGGRPARTVPPPAKVPSAAVRQQAAAAGDEDR
jgi:hypothetical protein